MTLCHTLRLDVDLPPRQVHKLLMRSISHIKLDPGSPRSDAAMTYRQDGRTLTVHTRDGITPALPWQAGEVVASQTLDFPSDTAPFEVTVARQYRPSVPRDPDVVALAARRGEVARTTGKLTPVPADRLDEWAAALLHRAGIEASGVHVEVAPDVSLDGSRRARIPAAKITATAPSTQLAAAIAAGGVGRGRNYGLGHITPTI